MRSGRPWNLPHEGEHGKRQPWSGTPGLGFLNTCDFTYPLIAWYAYTYATSMKYGCQYNWRADTSRHVSQCPSFCGIRDGDARRSTPSVHDFNRRYTLGTNAHTTYYTACCVKTTACFPFSIFRHFATFALRVQSALHSIGPESERYEINSKQTWNTI